MFLEETRDKVTIFFGGLCVMHWLLRDTTNLMGLFATNNALQMSFVRQ